MDYANETARINDVIRQYQEAPTEQFSEAVAENQTQLDATWKEQADEYAHKYSALAEGGGEEIAGALGLEGAYRGYKKLKSLYKDYKDARDKINDNLTKLKNPANKDKLQDPDNVDNTPTEEDPEPSQAPQESTEPPPAEQTEIDEPPTTENIEDIEPLAEEGADEDEIGRSMLNRLFQQSEDLERQTQQMRQQRIQETTPDEEPLRQGDNLTTDELEQNLRDAGFNEDQISNIRNRVQQNANPEDSAQPQEPSPQDPAPPEGEAPSGLDDISARQAIGAEPLGLDETDLQLEDPYEHQAVKGSEQDDDIQDFYNENDEKYFSGTQEEHDELFNPDGTAKAPDINPNLEYLRSKADTGLPTSEPVEDSVFRVGQSATTQDGIVGQARTNNVPIRATEEDMDESLNDFGTANPRSLYSETRVFGQPRNAPQPQPDINMEEPQFESDQPPEPSNVPSEVPEPSVDNPISSSDLTEATDDVRNVLGDTGEPASYLQDVELGDSFVGNLVNRGMSSIGSSLAQRGAGIRSAVQNVADRITAPATETLDEDALTNLAKTTAEKVLPEGGEELASFGLGDAVLGAVPVLGELALGVTGLVSVGEGLYHLFHHDAGNPPPAKTPQVGEPVVSNALTTKFAQGLPSVDGASELSGSMVSF